MKKNNKKTIVAVIAIISILIIMALFIPIKSENIIIKKGNWLFGKSSDKCRNIEMMTDDITKRKCILCNKSFKGSSSQIICVECSDITNRCCVCGRIKEEITGIY